MVETDPTLRASMGGVISEIRRVGGSSNVNNTPIQIDYLKPTSGNINAKNRSPSPGKRDIPPLNRDLPPMNRPQLPQNKDLLARAALPLMRDKSPMGRAELPFNRDRLPVNKAALPLRKDATPLHLPSGKPDTKAVFSPVPKGGKDLSQDFSKITLYEEVAKNLPCVLPTTGTIVVRRFEEKNGTVESWEQKEVVTRDGKIVKYDDVKFNSK